MDRTDRKQVLRLFDQINVWKRGAQRAPHKPLLLLYALSKCTRDGERKILYAEVDEKLKPLLEEFGPTRKSHHTEYPFWRLQNDGIWVVSDADKLERRSSNTDAKKSELLKHAVSGGFSEPIFQALRQDPQLLLNVASLLLEKSFPTSLHDDICLAVGLQKDLLAAINRPRRDPDFRPRVLTAYSYRCAVCSFDMRLGQHTVGLEAAHIKWYQAGGPDTVNNGLALCVMHHKLLDLGVFTVSDGRQIQISDRVHGYHGPDEWIFRYHGKSLSSPQSPDDLPHPAFLHWHQREVFKGSPRFLEYPES